MRYVVVAPCDVSRDKETYATMGQWADFNCHFMDWPHGGTSPTQKMQSAYIAWEVCDIIAYIHSDVSIYEEGWLKRVLAEFDDPTVGVVGFGGALGLGDPDIYKKPYQLVQLARYDYRSNTVDAEFHGERERGACDVATLDGFALIVRRELLDKTGGWPVELPFHNYDSFLCLMAHRHGYRVRMVGIECNHRGGGHSIKGDWQKQCVEEFGISDVEIHRRSHDYLYDEFRDELPIRVKE